MKSERTTIESRFADKTTAMAYYRAEGFGIGLAAVNTIKETEV